MHTTGTLDCKHLEVLKLSQVKISDRGVSLLLHHPLESLTELDLSHTPITSQCLQLLPQGMCYKGSRMKYSLNLSPPSLSLSHSFSGAPYLEVLTVDSTQVEFMHINSKYA